MRLVLLPVLLLSTCPPCCEHPSTLSLLHRRIDDCSPKRRLLWPVCIFHRQLFLSAALFACRGVGTSLASLSTPKDAEMFAAAGATSKLCCISPQQERVRRATTAAALRPAGRLAQSARGLSVLVRAERESRGEASAQTPDAEEATRKWGLEAGLWNVRVFVR